MSQASVPVNVDVIFRSDSAKAELRKMESELGEFVRRVDARGLDIPVRLDVGDASTALDEFYRSAGRDPLRVRMALDETLVRAQLDVLAEQVAAKPMVIPVTFQPVGGMPGGGGAWTVAGGGGTAGTLTGTAMAASMMMPAPIASPSNPLPAAAAAPAMLPPGTTYTPVQGGGFYPGPYYPAAPLAPTPAGFPVAAGATAAAEGAAAWSTWGTLGTAAAGAAGAAALGGMGGNAAGGEFLNMRLLRKALGGLMLAETAYHLGTGLVDAGLAASTSDLAARAEYIKSGQQAVGRLPVVGDLIVGAGEYGERGISAVSNYFSRGRGGHDGRFESDIAYGTRVTEEARAQDEHTKEIVRGADIRRRANDRLERAIRVNEREAATAGVRGSLDREAAGEAFARRTLEEELKKPEYHRRDGSLTDTAKAYRDSELARLNADADARRRKEDEARAALDDVATVADAKGRGDKAGARRAEFDQSLQRQAKAAYDVSRALGDEFWKTVAPALTREFTRNEQDLARKDQAKRASDGAAHADRMDAIHDRAAEARLRLGGESEIAVAKRRNDLEDELVRKAERRAEIEEDIGRKAMLTEEARAEREAANIIKAANLREATLRREMAIEQEMASARQMHLQAQGLNYQAKLQAIQDELNRAIQAAQGDLAKIQAAQERAKAARELLEHQRAVRIDDLNVSAEQHALRAQGRSEMADVVGVMHRLKRDLSENKGDPDTQQALMRDAAGELKEMLHRNDQPGIYGSTAEYAQHLQISALSGDGGAEETMRRLAQVLDNAGNNFARLNEALDKMLSGRMHNVIGVIASHGSY